MNSRLFGRVHTDGTWAYSRRTEKEKMSTKRRGSGTVMSQTFIFFWRQVMQPVLLRVYLGRLRWVASAALARGAARSRGLPVAGECWDE
jgi:hypothetical protein